MLQLRLMEIFTQMIHNSFVAKNLLFILKSNRYYEQKLQYMKLK